MKVAPTKQLRGDVAIPVVGLGVYQMTPGMPTRTAVRAALTGGYRHVDTARIYENEEDVGAAIRESGVPRKDIFLTTKLWNADHGYDKALKACDASLKRLGVEQLDLYLVHWPVAKKRDDTWRAMEQLLKEKKTRAIGVSNYTVRHLEELLQGSDVVPAVNQIELHPFLFARDIASFCEKKGIVVEAYSPLTRGERLDDPTIVRIANALGKTPAQVLIRWGLQHGFVSLPKSAHAKRIAENFAVFDFEIPAAQMKTLDALDEGLHTCWDPTNAP